MITKNTSDPNYDFYLSIIDDSTYWLALAVTGFIVAVVIVVGNFFLLLTMSKDPRKSLRSPTSILIANLSASDLLLGLFNVFLVALRDVYRSRLEHMPNVVVFKAIMYTVLTTTLFVSSYSIIAIMTCYIAISKPMEYKSIITKKRIKIFIAVLWVISLTTCVLPVTNISEKTFTLIYLHTHASLPAILLTVIYVNVFRALARRSRELTLNGITAIVNSKHVLERERKMTFTIIIILALFYVTYMPQYVTLHLLHFCKSCQQSITFHKVDVVLSRFLYISSTINPFIYAWRIPKYRIAFIDCLKMFVKKLKHSSQRDGGAVLLGGQNREQTVKKSREGLLRNTGKSRKDDYETSHATIV
ncbi:hypothetical protein ACROYT_G004957 [Oculina patagonica]